MTNTEYKSVVPGREKTQFRARSTAPMPNRTMFTLWTIAKSPLMLGTDLRDMEVGDDSYNIISNTDLIGVNQDPLGVQVGRKHVCYFFWQAR